MSSFDIIGMCVRNLFKRKLRTILTVLGVMVGTASIVVMISLGLAIDLKFQQQLETMGDVTLITVQGNDQGGGRYMSVAVSGDTGVAQQPGGPPKLDDNMIAKFEALPGVTVATPLEQANLYFKSGEYIMDAYNCYGIKAEAMAEMGYDLKQGRFLQEGDQYDAVFGVYAESSFHKSNSNNWWERQNTAMNGEEYETYVDLFEDKITMSYDYNYLYGNQNAAQEYDATDEDAPKPVKPINLNVVGLLDVKNDWQVDQGVFFDIEVLKKLKADGEKQNATNQQESGWYSAIQGSQQEGYQQAYVKADSLEVTKTVCEAIKAMGFYAYYQAEWLDQMQEQARSNQNFLAAIGAVSLFVAAIGIANTMIMSIYERTREIGVMKVIGAAIRDIKWMFLLESAMIGFFGGVMGVGLSYLVSYVLNNAKVAFFAQMFSYIGDPESVVSLITPWLCGVALAFAAVVGLVSGYFPARRAMRLSALTAIRTE